MRDDSFEWEVRLPERGSGGLGSAARPRAKVEVSSAAHGDEVFSVPVAVGRAMAARRRTGELRPASRNELIHASRELALACGRTRVQDLVDRRDYSAGELTERLLQEGYPASVAEALVARAVECGMVDDARFAGAFIRSKLFSGWGPIKIERELARRGIEARSIEGWPEAFFEDGSELDRAVELASRRRLTGKNDLQKIVRFLCSRGFSSSVAFDAARSALDAAQEED